MKTSNSPEKQTWLGVMLCQKSIIPHFKLWMSYSLTCIYKVY